MTRGSTLTSQDYNPSSVVYVPEPIRAILWYLALIETQSVVMTLSKFAAILVSNKLSNSNVKLALEMFATQYF